MTGIKLEVGKRYVDGIGDAETIIGRDADGMFVSNLDNRYTEEGYFLGVMGVHQSSDFNLIALAPDEAPTGDAALDALTELDQLRAHVKELEDRLFPYADETQICGMSWNGFHLIGNDKSINELQRVCHRSSQLEEFQNAFDARLEAEIARRTAAERDRDALRAENARLREALGYCREIADAIATAPIPLPMFKSKAIVVRECIENALASTGDAQ